MDLGTIVIVGGVIGAAVFVKQAILGLGDARREATTCSKCGAKFDSVSYFPTNVGGVHEPHYYCPNGHIRIGPTTSGGESTTDRLGGWSP